MLSVTKFLNPTGFPQISLVVTVKFGAGAGKIVIFLVVLSLQPVPVKVVTSFTYKIESDTFELFLNINVGLFRFVTLLSLTYQS